MKIAARHVRFLLPFFPWPGRRRLPLVGSGNTIQLLETAVVIEGHVKRLGMPVVDRFFQRVLSEWTTVTIPYSRILRHRVAHFLVLRVLLTTLLWLPALLPLLALVGPGVDVGAVLYVAGMLGLLALVLSLYLNLRFLAPRNYLLYQQADGRRMLTAFRIGSRKRQEAFAALLENNRQAAANLTPPPVPAQRERAPALPLGLLAVYLAAHHLVFPLWQLLFAPSIVPPRNPSVAGPGEPVLLALQFAYAQGPVLLLAALLWRWSEVVRWSAVLLLALHGVLAVLGPGTWGWLGGSAHVVGDSVELGTDNLASLVVHLALAVLLAVQRGPRPRGGSHASA
jgi:hypothetical protein